MPQQKINWNTPKVKVWYLHLLALDTVRDNDYKALKSSFVFSISINAIKVEALPNTLSIFFVPTTQALDVKLRWKQLGKSFDVTQVLALASIYGVGMGILVHSHSSIIKKGQTVSSKEATTNLNQILFILRGYLFSKAHGKWSLFHSQKYNRSANLSRQLSMLILRHYHH